MLDVACAHCGKCDDDANMFVCSGCFEVHFCSEDHFAQHPHSKIEDAQHFDPREEIGPNIRRLFTTADYKTGLTALAEDFWNYVKEPHVPINPRTIEILAQPVSKKLRADAKESWNDYVTAMQAAIQTNTFDEAKKVVSAHFINLVDVLAKENRLSVRQTRKSIESALSLYTALLLNIYFPDSAEKLSDWNRIKGAIPDIAKALGGGRMRN